MGSRNFSLPEYAERYEYVRFTPDQPFQLPVDGQAQIKPGHTFTINDRTGVYDYSKGYFDVRVSISNRADNTAPNGVHNVALVNGVHCIINRLQVQESRGAVLYDTTDVNVAVHKHKLLTMPLDYAVTLGENELWFHEDDQMLNRDVGLQPQLKSAISNTGHLSRKDIFATGQEISLKIPLNAYSFFRSLDFNNVFLTGMQMKFTVDLEEDIRALWQTYASANAGVVYRFVVHKMDLMLPQLNLHPKFADEYIKGLQSPIRWRYLRENVYTQGATQNQSGRFRLALLTNPKKVLIFFSRNRNLYAENFQHHDELTNIGANINPANGAVVNAGVALNSCRLEFSDGSFYPRSDYIHGTAKTDLARIYNDLMEYNYANDNLFGSTQIKRYLFENLHSMIYFNVEFHKMSVVSDAREMNFVYNLSGPSPAPYTITSVILYEQESSYGVIGNNFVITSENFSG